MSVGENEEQGANKDVGLTAGIGTGNCNYNMSMCNTAFSNPKQTTIPSSLCMTGSKTEACPDWMWNNSAGEKNKVWEMGNEHRRRTCGLYTDLCLWCNSQSVLKPQTIHPALVFRVSPISIHLIICCNNVVVSYQTERWKVDLLSIR